MTGERERERILYPHQLMSAAACTWRQLCQSHLRQYPESRADKNRKERQTKRKSYHWTKWREKSKWWGTRQRWLQIKYNSYKLIIGHLSNTHTYIYTLLSIYIYRRTNVDAVKAFLIRTLGRQIGVKLWWFLHVKSLPFHTCTEE